MKHFSVSNLTVLPKMKVYTAEEYLVLEEKSEYRSEYENGEIIAMAGGSLNHAQIIANLGRNIGNRIFERCRSLTTDVKVRVEEYHKFYYPDVLVICGNPSFYLGRNDTITNPQVVIEVLSNSTEAKDRGEKFFAYQTLESLQEYIWVSQNRAVVEHFVRQEDGSWRYLATIGLESVINIESLNIELTLSEIYQRIEFEEENL